MNRTLHKSTKRLVFLLNPPNDLLKHLLVDIANSFYIYHFASGLNMIIFLFILQYDSSSLVLTDSLNRQIIQLCNFHFSMCRKM